MWRWWCSGDDGNEDVSVGGVDGDVDVDLS